jgi:hypothetical protein
MLNANNFGLYNGLAGLGMAILQYSENLSLRKERLDINH